MSGGCYSSMGIPIIKIDWSEHRLVGIIDIITHAPRKPLIEGVCDELFFVNVCDQLIDIHELLEFHNQWNWCIAVYGFGSFVQLSNASREWFIVKIPQRHMFSLYSYNYVSKQTLGTLSGSPYICKGFLNIHVPYWIFIID